MRRSFVETLYENLIKQILRKRENKRLFENLSKWAKVEISYKFLLTGP